MAGSLPIVSTAATIDPRTEAIDSDLDSIAGNLESIERSSVSIVRDAASMRFRPESIEADPPATVAEVVVIVSVADSIISDRESIELETDSMQSNPASIHFRALSAGSEAHTMAGVTIAVLPAAGASRRMGRPKLLLPYKDNTIVGALVASLREAGVETIALVTAPGDEELQRWSAAAGLLTAVNPLPERGMLSTILEGLAALGAGGGEALLVSPADLPAVRPETIAEVVRRRAEAGAPLALPVWKGRHGHPLVIAPELIAEIATLDATVGLKQLRDRHAAATLWIDVDDPGVVQDVDTPEDYLALTARTEVAR